VCGRYVLVTPVDELASYFSATFAPELTIEQRASWNVAPTSLVVAVTQHESGRLLSDYRWGLVPWWAKDLSIGNRAFNARAETLATKPAFRSAFAARRALIPADGFYEWSKAPGEHRQPYYFTRTDSAPCAFAGLWESWRDPARSGEPGSRVRSCTIVTTAAGPDMGQIHDRQPVVLEASAWGRWLDPDIGDGEELEAMLVASPAGTLRRRRVGRDVGRVDNDGPGLIDELVS